MSFLSGIFGGNRDREALRPLYDGLVAAARDPFWYREGEVPDTVTGRFDMVTAVLALALLRLEAEGERARQESVLLTECFIEDMEGSVREFGAGDLMVGKRVGELVGALGGRIGAFRAAVDSGDLESAVNRNVFHEAPPSAEAPALVAGRLAGFYRKLQAVAADDLLTGAVPPP